MATYGGYRLRDLLLFGVGLTFLGGHLGTRVLSPWPLLAAFSPYLVAALAAGGLGWLVAEGNNGAGVGGLATGLGGFLFVFGNFAAPPVWGALTGDVPVEAALDGVGQAALFGVQTFALFGAVGMVVGGVVGLGHWYLQEGRTGGGDDQASDRA